MRRWMALSIFFTLCLAFIYFGFSFANLFGGRNAQSQAFSVNNMVNPLNTTGITENTELYNEDKQSKADELYVTILKSYPQGEPVEVYFRDGAKAALHNGVFLPVANATLELKGKSPEKDVQKSYKIKLYDKEGLWHNQKTINLNKHYADPLRIRNKLSFDYLSMIPDITSFRTRFVRLLINDASKASAKEGFEDYGLFTQIEQPNKMYLQNHRLDPNAHLYEAVKFNFSRYPEVILNKGDKGFSRSEFEKVLAIRGNDDNRKLIEMLEAVNDHSLNINQVIDQYFALDNYLTWLAVNILFDNYQAGETNYILYSPINSVKWYFMPWDFDQAWGWEKDRGQWQKGLSIYWGNVLHRRFLLEPGNVEALSKKIEEISKIASPDQTKVFLDSYYKIIMSNITMLPDLKYLPITLNNFKKEYQELPRMVEHNRLYYYESLNIPLPYWLNEPEVRGRQCLFSWEAAYDLQGDHISYILEISRDKNFSSIILTHQGLKEPQITVGSLEPGIYYWRVTAANTKGNRQIPLNIYRDEFGAKFYGIKKIII